MYVGVRGGTREPGRRSQGKCSHTKAYTSYTQAVGGRQNWVEGLLQIHEAPSMSPLQDGGKPTCFQDSVANCSSGRCLSHTGSFDLLGCGHSYEYCAGGRCRHGLCPLGRKEERGKELCAGITSVITALGERRPEDWELKVGKGQRHHVWSLALPAMCKAQPNVF